MISSRQESPVGQLSPWQSAFWARWWWRGSAKVRKSTQVIFAKAIWQLWPTLMDWGGEGGEKEKSFKPRYSQEKSWTMIRFYCDCSEKPKCVKDKRTCSSIPNLRMHVKTDGVEIYPQPWGSGSLYQNRYLMELKTSHILLYHRYIWFRFSMQSLNLWNIKGRKRKRSQSVNLFVEVGNIGQELIWRTFLKLTIRLQNRLVGILR